MSILNSVVAAGLTDSKTWPDDVKLYQPFEVEQILMDEFASCLAVKTVLKMLALSYQIELKINAHNMSPSGEVPFMKVESILVSEFEPIVAYLAAKGYSLSSSLPQTDYSDLRGYISFVHKSFNSTLLYVLWSQEETYQKITKKRYGSPYSWPLNRVLPWLKRQATLRHLHALHFTNKSVHQVYSELDECCEVLSKKLEDSKYFFGDSPTELDALVFGYLFSVLTTPLLDSQLADTVQRHSNLIHFCKNIHHEFFVDEDNKFMD